MVSPANVLAFLLQHWTALDPTDCRGSTDGHAVQVPGAGVTGQATGCARRLCFRTISVLDAPVPSAMFAAWQGYGGEYKKDDNFTAYEALVQEGVTFIDTAEVGRFCRAHHTALQRSARKRRCSDRDDPRLLPRAPKTQVYGFGLSEEFLGDFMRRSNTQPVIATKFAPLPWRFTSGSVVGACRCCMGTPRTARAAASLPLVMLGNPLCAPAEPAWSAWAYRRWACISSTGQVSGSIV